MGRSRLHTRRLVPAGADTTVIGACGSDVSMPAEVVAVRQSLVPLVAGGYPLAAAVATATASWPAWAQDSFIMSARTVAAS